MASEAGGLLEKFALLKREGTDGKIPKQWIRFAVKILET